MPHFSAFTPLGLFEFSSDKSDAEKVYNAISASYRDPTTGKSTIDLSTGTHAEAKTYSKAVAIGNARQIWKGVAKELRPETSYALLESHERAFKVIPGPNESISERRATLNAYQKIAIGPVYGAVKNALLDILGADLVCYVPIELNKAVSYPRFPQFGPGVFKRSDLINKSVRLTAPVTRPGNAGVCDEYVVANQSLTTNLGVSGRTGAAQSFTGDGRRLARAAFSIARGTAASVGTIVARVYAITGTFGSTSKPTGTPLATSLPVSVADLDVGTFEVLELPFEGKERITLTAGARYAVAVEYDNGSPSASSYITVGSDSSAPSHAGNAAYLVDGVWTNAAEDLVFRVRTGFAQWAYYETWNATAPPVQIAKGDHLTVDPGNWGLAERVEVLDAEIDGDRRRFLATFDRPHGAGAYAGTGTLPLWLSTKRHVLVIVTATASIDPLKRAKVNALFRRMMRGPTTWDMVQPSSPGLQVVGPFELGVSPLGAVPVEGGVFVCDGDLFLVTEASDPILTEASDSMLVEA